MRHYEIVILVHPDQSGQVPEMVARYRKIVEDGGGSVHREEDWGMRRLEYTIQKMHKAHYVLLNIECGDEALDELKQGFRYNDAVMRRLIIRCDKAQTGDSPLLRGKRKREAEEARRESEARVAEREAAKPAAGAGEDGDKAAQPAADDGAAKADEGEAAADAQQAQPAPPAPSAPPAEDEK